MFSTIAPFFLGMLPLATLPVIVHFLFRRKRRSVRYPSIMLLTTVYRTKGFFYRFKDVLLFLIRVLILALVIFFFAGLFLTPEKNALSGVRTYVFIIDNSASTTATVGRDSAFNAIREAAIKTARTLFSHTPGMTAIVVSANEPPRFAGSVEDVEHMIASLTTVEATLSLADTLDTVAMLLEREGVSRYAYALFTDAQKVNFKNLARRDVPTILFVPKTDTIKNATITHAEVADKLLFAGSDTKLSVHIETTNYTRDIKVNVVSPFVVYPSVTVPITKSNAIHVSVPLHVRETGMLPLRVELSEDDFTYDNVYYLPVHAEHTLTNALVDAKHAAAPTSSPSFFFANALVPGYESAKGRDYTLRHFTSPHDVSGAVDSVAVFGYGEEMPTLAKKMRAWIEEGVDVFFFPQTNVPPQSLAEALSGEGLLPVTKATYERPTLPQTLFLRTTNERIVRPFHNREHFRNVRIGSHFFPRIPTSLPNIAFPLVTGDDAPLFVMRYFPKARAHFILYTAPFTKENEGIHYSYFFPVLVHRMMYTIRARKYEVGTYPVGKHILFSAFEENDTISNFRLAGARERDLDATLFAGDTFTESGFYQASGKLFAVNIPKGERTLTYDDASRYFTVVANVGDSGGQLELAALLRGDDLSFLLYIILAILVLIEIALPADVGVREAAQHAFRRVRT